MDGSRVAPHTATAGPDPAGAMPGSQTVVARQAIYDAHFRLVAYELLFRRASAGDDEPFDGDVATSRVLTTAFVDIGVDQLVGDLRAFVNVPYQFLADGFCSSLPTDRVVLEILEDVVVDDRVVEVARRLVDEGHTLALDDFVFRDGTEPLLELARIVKLDVLALDADELARQVELVRPYSVKLLAEKVESRDQLPGLLEMGFEYFQGYALQRPTLVRGAHASANRLVLLQLLADLHDPGVEFSKTVDTVARDPSIAYAVLRIINSAHLSLATHVSSLHQALVLLGVDGLRNWTTMMVMSRLAGGSSECVSTGLVRAKMCEISAQRLGADAAASFTAGLLSALPDVLGQPLPEIVEQLALGDELSDALLNGGGSIGRVLECTLAYELDDPGRLAELGAPPAMADAFFEAVRWSTDLMDVLAGT
jgi:EAL and modified HD-GYP domain-containing signal transduction protein